MFVGIGEISGACSAIVLIAMSGVLVCTVEWIIVRMTWWLVVVDYRWVRWSGGWVAKGGHLIA